MDNVVVKSKRPSDSNFKQQRLPSWQPVLTAGTVLPTFFIIGIAFIPVGITLLYFSDAIAEHKVDYTKCLKIENNVVNTQNQTCATHISSHSPSSFDDACQCRIEFELKQDFVGDVFMYYELTNFYQNHRRYVKSRDDDQLLGNFGDPSAEAPSDCKPFDRGPDGKIIVPCGAIANSLFNDTLELRQLGSEKPISVERTGIAWPSDKDIKFRNPKDLKQALSGFDRPISWTRDLWDLDKENPENNGLQNEDLIVWMRTAALPNFRKLYRRVNANGNLPKGKYVLDIKYRYPVTQFDGTKSFILSTTSIIGGKNTFLGYAYIVVGSICLILGCVLLFVHLKYRSHAQASTTSTNPRTPYT